jgi:hypothetical protein
MTVAQKPQAVIFLGYNHLVRLLYAGTLTVDNLYDIFADHNAVFYSNTRREYLTGAEVDPGAAEAWYNHVSIGQNELNEGRQRLLQFVLEMDTAGQVLWTEQDFQTDELNQWLADRGLPEVTLSYPEFAPEHLEAAGRSLRYEVIGSL